MNELLKLANDDYQKRGGDYPKSLIPDIIRVELEKDGASISFDFKNTSDSEALNWYEKSKECKVINKFKKEYDISVSTSQNGDFKNDWQNLTVLLTTKDTIKSDTQASKTKTQSLPAELPKESKADDTNYSYCYVLTTLEQRKAIKLTQHKTKLEKIIKEFFGDKLLEVLFTDDSYRLTLTEEYTIGDKRRLGRLISEGSDLKKFVKKVIYNGNKDTSGQLFRLQKDVA